MLTIGDIGNPELTPELISIKAGLSPWRQADDGTAGRYRAQAIAGPALTRAIACTTASMLWLFSAATQMRPESTP